MNLLKAFQRGLKRFGLSHIAGQFLAAAEKAHLVQNQSSQRTVNSTLFRPPEAPRPLIVVLARTMIVRQVMEDNRCGNLGQTQQVRWKSSHLLFFAGLSEHERNLVNERTEEGRASAGKRGVKLGRKIKLTPHQQDQARVMLKDGQSIRAIARHFNVGAATIDRIKRTTQLS